MNWSIAPLIQRKLYRAIWQGREKGVDLVNQAITEAPTGLGVEVEAHSDSILVWQGRKKKYLPRRAQRNTGWDFGWSSALALHQYWWANGGFSSRGTSGEAPRWVCLLCRPEGLLYPNPRQREVRGPFWLGRGRDDCCSLPNHPTKSILLPRCSLCPLWLKPFPDGAAGTESRRGWCANR